MTTKLNTKTTKTAAAAAQTAGNVKAEQPSAAMFNGFEMPAMPSKTRQLIASIAQLVTFATSFYWGSQAIGWLCTAVIAFTGSGFIGFCLMLVTAVMTWLSAWRAGAAVNEFMLNFDVNNVGSNAREIGRDLRLAAAQKVNLVKGWFKRDDQIIVDAASA